MFAAQVGNRHTVLCLLQDRPSRQIAVQSPAGQCMICASLYFDFFIRISSSTFEKILLPHTPNFRGDYPGTDIRRRRISQLGQNAKPGAKNTCGDEKEDRAAKRDRKDRVVCADRPIQLETRKNLPGLIGL